MSIFSTILSKLGLGKQAPTATAAPAPAKTTAPAPAKTAAPAPQKAAAPAPMKAAAPAPMKAVAPAPRAATAPPAPVAASRAPAPIPVVDVVAQLDALAAKTPGDLNWKNSIVDLLKLLGMDSSYAARKELAIELGCPADQMSDSARMNVWLHKTVLNKIAQNGGNVPKELLD